VGLFVLPTRVKIYPEVGVWFPPEKILEIDQDGMVAELVPPIHPNCRCVMIPIDQGTRYG